jgi:hypothetical protein
MSRNLFFALLILSIPDLARADDCVALAPYLRDTTFSQTANTQTSQQFRESLAILQKTLQTYDAHSFSGGGSYGPYSGQADYSDLKNQVDSLYQLTQSSDWDSNFQSGTNQQAFNTLSQGAIQLFAQICGQEPTNPMIRLARPTGAGIEIIIQANGAGEWSEAKPIVWSPHVSDDTALQCTLIQTGAGEKVTRNQDVGIRISFGGSATITCKRLKPGGGMVTLTTEPNFPNISMQFVEVPPLTPPTTVATKKANIGYCDWQLSPTPAGFDQCDLTKPDRLYLIPQSAGGASYCTTLPATKDMLEDNEQLLVGSQVIFDPGPPRTHTDSNGKIHGDGKITIVSAIAANAKTFKICEFQRGTSEEWQDFDYPNASLTFSVVRRL